ncbi:MAG: hypothetical protein IPK68_02855 [Bdellovibrionales bacterium]|nr:hypothetical protein [Bdellovibrionales bacterium]
MDSKNTVSNGLALPISAFANALKLGRIDQMALGDYIRVRLKAASSPLARPDVVLKYLDEIRNAFLTVELPTDFTNAVIKDVEKTFAQGTKIKLRSSSNAEDSPNFNGAGLYSSLGACVGDDKVMDNVSLCSKAKKPKLPKTVLVALRGVWASLYNNKAFWVRQRYGIDEDLVGMGVLIQPAFKNEAANGVLISESTQGYEGPEQLSLITGFPGEDLEVTNPPANKVPETVRVSSAQIEVLVPTSELPAGRNILLNSQYRELHNLAGKVQEKYEKMFKLKIGQVKLDMEWKLMPEESAERLIIKQVRPIPSVNLNKTAANQSILLGSKGLRACSSSQETPHAMAKLLLGQPGIIDIKSVFVSADPQTQIVNPVVSYVISDPMGAQTVFGADGSARLEVEQWRAYGYGNLESRSVTLEAPIKSISGKRSLIWNFNQYRENGKFKSELIALAQMHFSVKGFWAGQEIIWSQRTSLVSSAECLGDLYNGLIPGFDYDDEIAHRAPPFPHSKILSGPSHAFSMNGRTAIQGVDKTMFVHVEKAQLKGVLSRPLEWENPQAVVYAPAHHNFDDEWGMDPFAATNLSNAEKMN